MVQMKEYKMEERRSQFKSLCLDKAHIAWHTLGLCLNFRLVYLNYLLGLAGMELTFPYSACPYSAVSFICS